jgi:nucleotide-binding universal stress UspA family protein
MYSRILLAYDGTREGLVALREGALLAKLCGAKIFLLSVLPEKQGLIAAEGVYSDVVGQQIDSYKALLGRGVNALKQLGFSPVSRLVIGEPAPEIGAFAKEVGADLVVLGHRKQNLIQRWWSGGTGAYISEHVTCSVLIGRNAISDQDFEAALKQARELDAPPAMP